MLTINTKHKIRLKIKGKNVNTVKYIVDNRQATNTDLFQGDHWQSSKKHTQGNLSVKPSSLREMQLISRTKLVESSPMTAENTVGQYSADYITLEHFPCYNGYEETRMECTRSPKLRFK